MTDRVSAVDYLTPKQLADRYGVTVRTIYAWNAAGTGPLHFKIGGQLYYRLSDVQVWEARGARGGEAAVEALS